MKVRTWHIMFRWLLIVAISFTTFSAIPPIVPFGVYAGIFCILLSAGFVYYTHRLIRCGRGDEIRP